MMEQGWIGTIRQLLHVLAIYGVDRDEEGAFIVRGSIHSFLGLGEEYVVGSDAQARINDQWTGIVPMLRSTSYGMGITVIDATRGDDDGLHA